MLLNKEIKPYLYPLEDIYQKNRQRYPNQISLSLHLTTLDYMRYWRLLESTVFPDWSGEAQDELYYWFTEKLLHLYEIHLDPYWLIGDVDNKPLFACGREPARFWRKRKIIKRFRYTY